MAKVALDLESDILPVSDFRANASAMLEQVKHVNGGAKARSGGEIRA